MTMRTAKVSAIISCFDLQCIISRTSTCLMHIFMLELLLEVFSLCWKVSRLYIQEQCHGNMFIIKQTKNELKKKQLWISFSQHVVSYANTHTPD